MVFSIIFNDLEKILRLNPQLQYQIELLGDLFYYVKKCIGIQYEKIDIYEMVSIRKYPLRNSSDRIYSKLSETLNILIDENGFRVNLLNKIQNICYCNNIANKASKCDKILNNIFLAYCNHIKAEYYMCLRKMYVPREIVEIINDYVL